MLLWRRNAPMKPMNLLRGGELYTSRMGFNFQSRDWIECVAFLADTRLYRRGLVMKYTPKIP